MPTTCVIVTRSELVEYQRLVYHQKGTNRVGSKEYTLSDLAVEGFADIHSHNEPNDTAY